MVKQVLDNQCSSAKHNDQKCLYGNHFGSCGDPIEAILNSRPLCQVSSDPNNFSPLTPTHFLKMGPAQIFPELDESSNPVTGSLRGHFYN
ncbi:hypothetical protein PR048_016156 [Dryococelus australis]|uniref:Uncharacterized protein n=1 Tax=Dryococelus australis TaxID=614101 RepID=A0ABQ9HIZ0_9NEOP|nr:hypothetical protein PR048_016156 [Dryococelus australis]